METQNRQTTYSHWKQADKHYFAGYLNQAVGNLEEVVKELVSRGINIKGGSTKAKLNDLFKDGLSLVEYERRVQFLACYFPVAEYLDKKVETGNKGGGKPISCADRIEHMRTQLGLLVNLLIDLRHYYTHNQHKPIDIAQGVTDCLDDLLLKVATEVKKKYLKTDKTKELLSKSLEQELQKLMVLQKAESEKKKEEGKKICTDEETLRNTIYNNAFKGILHKDGLADRSESGLNRWNTFDDTDCREDVKLSQSGLIFLLSMFLQKKDIELFKDKIKGFKAKVVDINEVSLDNNSIRNMAVHRVYSCLAYRGLKHKLRTDEAFDKEGFLIQMLDELTKVPHVVYEALNEEEKLKYVADWNEYYKEGSDNEKVKHAVIRKRYEDKFPYFAVRFLDEFVEFPNLRFQIHIGDYLHDMRDKDRGETGLVSRAVKEKICVFGRMSDVVAHKSKLIEQLTEKKREGQGWELFPNPHYLFPVEVDLKTKKQVPAGKIGIYLDVADYYMEKVEKAKKESEEETGKETLVRSDKKTSKEDMLSGTDLKWGQPTAYLSFRDVYNLLYAFIEENKAPEELENALRQQIEEQIREPLKRNKEGEIVPQRNPPKGKLEKAIERERDELNAKKAELQKQRDEKNAWERSNVQQRKGLTKRTQVLYASEKGRVATWLANDIKRFMEKEDRKKWRSYHHNELQKALAYYETEKDVVIRLLTDFRFSDVISSILPKCWKEQSLEAFYECYLDKRLIKVEKMLLSEEVGYPNSDKYFRPKYYQEKKTSEEERRNNVLKHPIQIKRGVISLANSEAGKFWSRFYREQQYQAFYDGAVERLRNEGKKEKEWDAVKKQQKSDYFVKLMAEYLFKHLLKTECKINLKEDIFPEVGNPKPTNFWETTYPQTMDGRAHSIDVKLRDLGNYRRYVTDERIKCMLAYEPAKKWHIYRPNDQTVSRHEVLEEQIDAYEESRRAVLCQIHLVEECLEKKAKEAGKPLNQRKKPNFRQLVMCALGDSQATDDSKEMSLEALKGLNERDKWLEILIRLRNCFSHNKLPKADFWTFCKDEYPKVNQENVLYGEYFAEVFAKVKNDLKIVTE